ncbi:M28 family metallopeptidase [Flavitalea sp. BT771]|uniref:M28 family metallopeptidase n=1 Tax=Flavitalea sp. BT771 TaxID=3063329 RepID=UPI0026E47CBB|nr:M28 family metallopeptidase [Flavitalea sp. BT771]MDO6435001.1 M28 family metallopeptidase [Flavitalea sp. BT771]MDV6223901.1 M28 family metallopeptidase [Flavitalea sp. BT771]
MKKLIFIGAVCIGCACDGQTIVNRDPEIERMVKEVNADSLQAYIKAMVSFKTRSTVSSTTDSRAGIGAARNWVLAKFNQFAVGSAGRLSAFVDTTIYVADGNRVKSNINLGNTVATLKGTDPNDNRIFIISGHLDSRRTDVLDGVGEAPGANDDGSGSAAVLECARIMSRHAFPATIIFVTVSGEEQGLLGSTYMAKKAKAANWNIAAVLNNDIIGSNNSNQTHIIDNTRVRVFSEGLPAYELDKQSKTIRQLGLENDGKARQLARYVKETGERYVDNLTVMMVYRPDRFLRGGDHIPYVDNGYAAVRITEMNENFNHQHQDVRTENGVVYGDLPEFMDFEYLRRNTGVNLAVLANLAKAPGVPVDVAIEVRNLTNSTLLRWKAPVNGVSKGYFVLVRETTSAVWQKKFYTTAMEMELPFSKDNYFFAVQAVSEGGSESLPVVPVPGR